METIEWPVSYAGCGPCPEDAQPFEGMAVEYLWNWTGQRYGLIALDVRPCLTGCYGSTMYDGPGGLRPLQGNPGSSTVPNTSLVTSCGRCRGSRCDCSMLNSLVLPAPVAEITSVTIDGVVLDPAAYTVYDDRYLMRMDGGEWPRCQDFTQAAGLEGTWSVAYKRGIAAPEGGSIAAGVLACELAKAACNSSSCQLPQRLQSITRQGVTMAVLDPFEGLDSGRTGIWLIDSWVASVTKAPRGGSVRSVDVSPSTRRWK